MIACCTCCQSDPGSLSPQPDVKCVGKEDVPEGSAVKLEVATDDCVSIEESSFKLSQTWL